MSVSPSAISGEFAGRYTVEREIGRGATSIVYVARDHEFARSVAIKVLRHELAESVAADQFLREIRLTAQLHHPHILPVLNSGTDGGRLFFVLPFMDGGTLRARLQREKQLPIAEVVAIGVTIAHALGAAHEKNLLHRDVKPENILFTAGQACLSDFGIARAITYASGDSTTSTGLVRGTPAYMSPEQAAGDREIDARSDIYSLACVLYEALAGIPAFVGATSQAIVAQRILYGPRPVRVYRSSVSPELEAVLARGLAISPADRYQAAKAFAEALAGVPTTPTADYSVPGDKAKPRLSRGVVVALGILAAASLTFASWRAGIFQPLILGARLDTARIAVLPFDGVGRDTNEIDPADLILNGLQRWRGISAVEEFSVKAAIRDLKPNPSDDDFRRVARRLGAGRYVRGRVTRSSVVRSLEAVMLDSRSGSTVYSVRLSVPADTGEAVAFYASVADSLLLRGATDVGLPPGARETRSLAGAQAFARARLLLKEWQLARSESLFAESARRDSGSVRSFLWLAQVRVWRARAPGDLVAARISAEHAALDTARLPRSERLIAAALVHLTNARYPAACQAYREIVRSDSLSFIGWFGLAQCNDFDRIVLKDPSSPTTWRFRSSRHQGITAYIRSLELFPAARSGLATSSFVEIREKLSTSVRNMQSGVTDDSTAKRFIARAQLRGDTLAFDPLPLLDPAPPGYRTDWDAVRRAVTRQRNAFHQVAAAWVVAEPRAADAREAYAISLEVLGDPAAADSFETTLNLTSDRTQRLRIAAAAILNRVKASAASELSGVERARHSADSILRATEPASFAEAEILARLAGLLGRCTDAARFTRSAAQPISELARVPQFVVANANALTVLTALGCARPADQPSIDDIGRDIARLGSAGMNIPMAESLLLRAVVNATFPPDSSWLARFIRPTSFLALAERAWLRNDIPLARAYLDSVARARASAMPGDVTPDATLPEARLRLAIGDTAAAVGVLDLTLAGLRYYAPMSGYEGVGNVFLIGSLIRAMALRGQLPSRDTRMAARWADVVEILWSTADPEIRPRPRRIASLHSPRCATISRTGRSSCKTI